MALKTTNNGAFFNKLSLSLLLEKEADERKRNGVEMGREESGIQWPQWQGWQWATSFSP